MLAARTRQRRSIHGRFQYLALAIVLLIVITIFGTKRLRNVGSDLGSAIRRFKQSLDEDKPAGEPPRTRPGEHCPRAMRSR